MPAILQWTLKETPVSALCLGQEQQWIHWPEEVMGDSLGIDNHDKGKEEDKEWVPFEQVQVPESVRHCTLTLP